MFLGTFLINMAHILALSHLRQGMSVVEESKVWVNNYANTEPFSVTSHVPRTFCVVSRLTLTLTLEVRTMTSFIYTNEKTKKRVWGTC